MTTAVLILARTLHIGSAMLLVALPYFMLIVLRPSFASDFAKIRDAFSKSVTRWLWILLMVEAVSGFVWFWFVAAQMSDQSPWGILDAGDLKTVLVQTQFGQLWLGRGVIGVVLAVVLGFISKAKATGRPAFALGWSTLILGSVLLLSLAWAGHAVAGIHFKVLHLAADALHLVIGAIWPMGLVPLGLFLSHVRSDDQAVVEGGEIEVLQRFSQISLAAVLLLIGTGMINGWLMVGSWKALVTTTYGMLLLGKVLLVGIMIGIGAFNRLCLLPRMRGEPTLLRKLRKTVMVESGLALVVLLMVGILGTTAPPS
jgi:putative copper resistance protein D